MFYENQIVDQTYQVIREIGKGGTGVVFLAYHLRLQKYVVLKQISNQGFDNISRTEVDTLKSLHHPNLPQVYDFLEIGNYVYTVMDYIEGYDLTQYIQTNTVIPSDCLIRWFRQLTEVLIYLHSQNPAVIHSDIKPGNIIITPENNAVLIDFNVSVSYRPDTLIGISLNYASPEQISLMQDQKMGVASDYIDGRSDIYSLGATFYHLMTFIQPSLFYGFQPLSSIETSYPETFTDIIDKAMAVEREDRFQSASEMLRRLDGMWRRTAAFKGYVAAQIAVILVSAALIAIGAFTLISGTRTEARVRFIEAYNECIQDVNSGNYSGTASKLMNFLNTYEKELESEPEYKKEILTGLAVSNYEQGNYSQAASYYVEAINLMRNSDPNLTACYVGAVQAYISAGDIDSARSVISKAENSGVSEEKCRLFRVQMNSGIEGMENECIDAAKELIAGSSDPDIRTRAAIAAGKAMFRREDYQNAKHKESLEMFRTALDTVKAGTGLTKRTELLRQSGAELLKLAAASSTQEAIESSALKSAEEAYTSIPATEKNVNDYINLATIYRYSGSYTKAIDTLNELENSKILTIPVRLLYMHKAICYDAAGDVNNAKAAVKTALEAGLTKSDVSDAFWEKFSEIRDRFGL